MNGTIKVLRGCLPFISCSLYNNNKKKKKISLLTLFYHEISSVSAAVLAPLEAGMAVFDYKWELSYHLYQGCR